MEVDVLAGEQGPSCQSMKHVKDLQLIYIIYIIRFIKRETLNGETSTSLITITVKITVKSQHNHS